VVNLTVFSVVTVFLGLGLLIYVIMIFNGLIRLKININKAWANIDVLLKQRHDEIPNLIAVVQGYKNFESDVITQVTQARSAGVSAGSIPQKAGAEKRITSALDHLFAVAENYPTLKAQQNFLQLQKRLSELESAIADRRTFYNDSVAAYNTRIHQVPDVFLAAPLGFQDRDLFKVAEGDKGVVKVELSNP
jgi:LemA protein